MKRPDLGGRLRRASATVEGCRHEIQGRFPNDSASPNASLVGDMACRVLAIAALVLQPREDSPQ